MKQYPKYKDSGIQWIGQIPEEWKVQTMKHFFYLKGRIGWQGLKAEEFVNEGPYLVTGTDFENGKVNWERCYHITKERYLEAPEIHVKEGDLLITKDGTIGKLAYIDVLPGETSLNSHLLIIRPISSHIINKFTYWLLQSDMFKQYTKLAQSGSIMESLSQEKVANFRFPLPPLTEQESIVLYLDNKTSKIDECIRLLELQKTGIKAYQHTMLIEAVTQGIKGVSNVKLWKRLPLRHVCDFRNGYTPSKGNHTYWEHGTIPWYRMDDIRENGRKLNTAKQYITAEAVKGGGLFEAGSFILATTATIGEHAFLIADSLANQQFTNLKIRKSLEEKLSQEYFFYYLFYIDDICKTITRISTFPAVDMEKLRQIKVCIPPISEQQAIVDYLDTKTAKIDETIANIDAQIADLRDYRSALISDVVTGKIDVRNAN